MEGLESGSSGVALTTVLAFWLFYFVFETGVLALALALLELFL